MRRSSSQSEIASKPPIPLSSLKREDLQTIKKYSSQENINKPEAKLCYTSKSSSGVSSVPGDLNSSSSTEEKCPTSCERLISTPKDEKLSKEEDQPTPPPLNEEIPMPPPEEEDVPQPPPEDEIPQPPPEEDEVPNPPLAEDGQNEVPQPPCEDDEIPNPPPEEDLPKPPPEEDVPKPPPEEEVPQPPPEEEIPKPLIDKAPLKPFLKENGTEEKDRKNCPAPASPKTNSPSAAQQNAKDNSIQPKQINSASQGATLQSKSAVPNGVQSSSSNTRKPAPTRSASVESIKAALAKQVENSAPAVKPAESAKGSASGSVAKKALAFSQKSSEETKASPPLVQLKHPDQSKNVIALATKLSVPAPVAVSAQTPTPKLAPVQAVKPPATPINRQIAASNTKPRSTSVLTKSPNTLQLPTKPATKASPTVKPLEPTISPSLKPIGEPKVAPASLKSEEKLSVRSLQDDDELPPPPPEIDPPSLAANTKVQAKADGNPSDVIPSPKSASTSKTDKKHGHSHSHKKHRHKKAALPPLLPDIAPPPLDIPPPGIDVPPPPMDFIPPPSTAIPPPNPAGDTWKQKLSPEILLKLPDLLRKRKLIADEMLSTEIFYCQALNTVVDKFLKPLKLVPRGLQQDDIFNLFSNVEVIRNCHDKYESRIHKFVTYFRLRVVMQDFMNKWNDSSTLGTMFLENALVFFLLLLTVTGSFHKVV